MFDGPIDYGFRTTAAYYDNVLGAKQVFTDNATASASVSQIKSGCEVHALIVKNASGGSVAPGSIVTWSSPGTTTGAVAGDSAAGAGVVDPTLTSSVADGEKYLLFVYGPVEVLSSAAINAGASVRTAASGKSVTNAKSTAADLLGAFGKQIVAATDADQLRRTFVDFRVR